MAIPRESRSRAAFWTRPRACATTSGMRDKNVPPAPAKAREKGAKSVRLSEALRANLARRKAQKRARDPGQGSKEQR